MSAHRLILLALVAAVLISQGAEAAGRPKDVIVGFHTPRDHMLQREFVKIPSKWLRVVKTRKTYLGDNYSSITEVRLLDQNKNGNGATATVVAGGPGYTYITIDFKSTRGHSIDFIVVIFGR